MTLLEFIETTFIFLNYKFALILFLWKVDEILKYFRFVDLGELCRKSHSDQRGFLFCINFYLWTFGWFSHNTLWFDYLLGNRDDPFGGVDLYLFGAGLQGLKLAKRYSTWFRHSTGLRLYLNGNFTLFFNIRLDVL